MVPGEWDQTTDLVSKVTSQCSQPTPKGIDPSQDELAKRANVSLSRVRNFQKGRRTPVRTNLLAIRHALEQSGIKFQFDGDTPTGASADR